MRIKPFSHRKTISLALQGGGAHGAFTWGVLDYLLEVGHLDFDAVSGTSAGAMNAAVLAQGLMAGGREGARKALAAFWRAVASSVPFDVTVRTLDGHSGTLAPAMKMMLMWANFFSPYELNPFDHNPLRDVVTKQIDFDRLRHASPLRLFIAATEANTGRLRLFREHELTADALLASACLPSVHHSIEIDGEHYWDGGFAANPAVSPLFYHGRSRDILLVLINPMRHSKTPRSADEIRTRSMVLGFSANFLREMRMFAHAREFAAQQPWWSRGRLERRLLSTNFHLIEASEVMSRLSAESKLSPSGSFLQLLHDLGRERARQWHAESGHHVGERPSVEVAGLFGARP
ncbi:MAG: patatin-like phospholipase family protein [Proteobacteria bacterium]|nr:MAG: patatin-like phospholipase family protein [Pseudomonadota bacterium]